MQPKVYSTKEAGFTLVEVLVGLVVITGFITTAMQAFVAATAFKVKGQELSEATTWIQEDLERVKYEANKLDFDGSSYILGLIALKSCQATSKEEGYAARLQDRINSNAPVDTNKTSTIGNRPYIFTRTSSLPSTAPFNFLAVKYEVESADALAAALAANEPPPPPIAITQAKVIPDASLACP
ncbi:prepilin-type N-terminal cleavage/methylation domain-containing protein [Acaryochloris sp. 'Moss Beach']|uniref:prepilin-type N-terminal cleavage/methylation domain-containing protein n=1 Tax=Acaryochloris sp. 'Moss Beach' TaxID=2740837 RepID=UPI001F19DE7F|nr:prepilin-type N-terminal cleavage/methylation domain-containing protein [Acaryochloris sp. 'Moss Beach']